MTNAIKHVLLVVISVTVLLGCEDSMLDLQPISEISEAEYFTNAEEVESGVIAIYDGLQELPEVEYLLTEMRSDNAESFLSEGERGQFEDLNVLPTNGTIYEYWLFNYNVIFRSNKVLEKLEVVTDQSLHDQFEGEAKFTRALAHFNLVRAFGDVPIVDQVVRSSDEEYFERDPSGDVLAAITSDLEDAVSLLPSKADMDFGRATSGAAKALLAKVYLTTGNYGSAESLLGDMISDAEYELINNYRDIFYSEQNNEIIFAIPYIADSEAESQGFSDFMVPPGEGRGLNILTQDFIDAIEPADTERNAVLRSEPGGRKNGKYIPQSTDPELAGNDWIVLRMADVYLMYAEAIFAGSSSTQDISAIQAYNAVRERVGLSTLPEDGSATLTLETLMQERRIELGFENHRLYDLIRTGLASSTLSAFANEQGFPFSETDLLLPIPLIEINASDGLLSQNPGY